MGLVHYSDSDEDHKEIKKKSTSRDGSRSPELRKKSSKHYDKSKSNSSSPTRNLHKRRSRSNSSSRYSSKSSKKSKKNKKSNSPSHRKHKHKSLSRSVSPKYVSLHSSSSRSRSRSPSYRKKKRRSRSPSKRSKRSLSKEYSSRSKRRSKSRTKSPSYRRKHKSRSPYSRFRSSLSRSRSKSRNRRSNSRLKSGTSRKKSRSKSKEKFCAFKTAIPIGLESLTNEKDESKTDKIDMSGLSAIEKANYEIKLAIESVEKERSKSFMNLPMTDTLKNFEEQFKRASDISSIEMGDFVPKSFKSTREGKTVHIDNHAAAMFSSSQIADIIKTNNRTEPSKVENESVMHPNFYVAQDIRMEKWQKKLFELMYAKAESSQDVI